MTPHPKTTAAKAAVKIKKQPVPRKAPVIAAEAKRVAKPKASAVEAPPRPKTDGAGAKPPKKPPAPPAAPEKAGSKTDMLIGMLSTPGGATSKELEEATGWKSHSVRGLLGTLRARGLSITSKKVKGEATVYRIVVPPSEPVGDVV